MSVNYVRENAPNTRCREISAHVFTNAGFNDRLSLVLRIYRMHDDIVFDDSRLTALCILYVVDRRSARSGKQKCYLLSSKILNMSQK